jgi:hypothetical protein
VSPGFAACRPRPGRGMMAAVLEEAKATKAALGPLYAVLSDDQKKITDRLIQGPM